MYTIFTLTILKTLKMKKRFIYIFFGVINFHLSAQTGLDFNGNDVYVNCLQDCIL